MAASIAAQVQARATKATGDKTAPNTSGHEPAGTMRASYFRRSHLPLHPASIPVHSGAGGSIESSHSAASDTLLPLQRKLAIGSTTDPLEAEADRVANQVMGMSAPSPQSAASGAAPAVRRKCSCEGSGSECPECKKKSEEKLQRKAQSPVSPVEAPPIVHNVLRSPGQQLDAATRAFFEPRFGADFGDVRVHTDSEAGKSARAVQAHAYTVGRDIVFAETQYAPGTAAGNKILAHELTHVVQQSDMPTNASPALRPEGTSKQQGAKAGNPVHGNSMPMGGISQFKIQPTVQRDQAGNTQSLTWRELAKQSVPWQQWTQNQKETAEADYDAELKKLTTPADIIDFMTPPYKNEVKRLLAPYTKDMAAFRQMMTTTFLEPAAPSATWVSTLQYEAAAGTRVTLNARVNIPTSTNPNPPTGEVMFEIFKDSVGQVDLQRVQSVGACVTSNSQVFGPRTDCTAKATYVTIPLTKGKYRVKATYQPLNTGARSSYTEVFLEVK
jgi:hypothetical protein